MSSSDIQIFNSVGNRIVVSIEKIDKYSYRINLNNFSPGVYFAIIGKGNVEEVTKFMVE